jgi:molybdenum cofactor cytidylyltransferase
MSRSISLGLAALETTQAGAALVALGDQPATRLDVIERLVATWRAARSAMLVPRYGIGGAGNPVIVAREIWPRAATLRGDRGLRVLVGARPDLAAYLEVEGANPDVDDAAGLAAVGSVSE